MFAGAHQLTLDDSLPCLLSAMPSDCEHSSTFVTTFPCWLVNNLLCRRKLPIDDNPAMSLDCVILQAVPLFKLTIGRGVVR